MSSDSHTNPEEEAARCRYLPQKDGKILRCCHPGHSKSKCRPIMLGGYLGEAHDRRVVAFLVSRGQVDLDKTGQSEP